MRKIILRNTNKCSKMSTVKKREKFRLKRKIIKISIKITQCQNNFKLIKIQ